MPGHLRAERAVHVGQAQPGGAAGVVEVLFGRARRFCWLGDSGRLALYRLVVDEEPGRLRGAECAWETERPQCFRGAGRFGKDFRPSGARESAVAIGARRSRGRSRSGWVEPILGGTYVVFSETWTRSSFGLRSRNPSATPLRGVAHV